MLANNRPMSSNVPAHFFKMVVADVRNDADVRLDEPVLTNPLQLRSNSHTLDDGHVHGPAGRLAQKPYLLVHPVCAPAALAAAPSRQDR